jgi:methionyl-tRNA formyltransferase
MDVKMDKGNIVLCIAGKNNIAIEILDEVRCKYPEIQILACCNSTDNGDNGFQRSYRAYCELKRVKIVELHELYEIGELVFLSLEFDRLIIPSKFISDKLYNIHFSLLPAYKGMFTSALPLLYGELYSGVTLHKIDAGIDTGDIIDQKQIMLGEDMSSEQLYNAYINYGTKLVSNNLESIIYNNVIGEKQATNNASYYSKKSIDYSNLKIDLFKTAFEIKRQIQAFYFPFYQLPVVNGYQVYKSSILGSKSSFKCGTVIKDYDFYFDISTIDYDLRLFKDRREELFKSAKLGDITSLEHLISNGYDIFQRSKEGWDIAIISAYNGKFEYLEYLLGKLHWDINTKNNNGTTLLMYCMTYSSSHDCPEFLMKFLKCYETDLYAKDYFDKDVMFYAEKYGNQRIVNIFKLNT